MSLSKAESAAPVVLRKDIILPQSQVPAVIISLNRPEQLNAFNTDVCKLLCHHFSSIARDIEQYNNNSSSSSSSSNTNNGRQNQPPPAVVIVTGEGRSFCAGADLANPPNPLRQSSDLYQYDNPVYWMGRLDVPIIAAIRGHCITGGFEIALACDILIGDQTTVFKDTHVKFGFAPCWGLSQRLQRRIGPGRAKLLALTARTITADQALSWGLLDEMATSSSSSAADNGTGADALSRALEVADEMGRQDDLMLQRYKRVIVEGGMVDLRKGLERERELAMAHYLEIVEDKRRFDDAKTFIEGGERNRNANIRSKL